MRSTGPILTPRQWKALQLRARGLTQIQVAKRLRTSRENISIIKHRARADMRAGRDALTAIEQLSESRELVIQSGTKIFEAMSRILVGASDPGTRLPFPPVSGE